MEIWYSHVSPYPLALCYIEFAKWYDFSRKTTILSGSVGIPYDPPYAVLVGLKFDLGVLQGVWRGMVGGRGGEGVLVAVPGQHALDGDHSEFGKGQVPEIGTDTREFWWQYL